MKVITGKPYGGWLRHAIPISAATEIYNNGVLFAARRSAACGLKGGEMRWFRLTLDPRAPDAVIIDGREFERFNANVDMPCPRCLAMLRRGEFSHNMNLYPHNLDNSEWCDDCEAPEIVREVEER